MSDFCVKYIDQWITWCTWWYMQYDQYINDAILATSNGINVLPNFAGRQTIETVNSAIEGTCYTMLAVFFLIEVINTYLTKGEEMRWEDVARMLIKLLICKNLLSMAPVILSVLQSTVSSTILGTEIESSVTGIAGTQIEMMKSDMLRYLEEIKYGNSIKNMIHNTGVMMEITFTGLANWVLALLTTLLSLLIMAMAYLRAFELVILGALSGIPLVFYAYSETKDIPKRFLLNYLAVCLQGLVIMVCLTLYANLLQGAGGKLSVLIWGVVSAFAVTKSGQWAKDVLGQ